MCTTKDIYSSFATLLINSATQGFLSNGLEKYTECVTWRSVFASSTTQRGRVAVARTNFYRVVVTRANEE